MLLPFIFIRQFIIIVALKRCYPYQACKTHIKEQCIYFFIFIFHRQVDSAVTQSLNLKQTHFRNCKYIWKQQHRHLLFHLLPKLYIEEKV